MRKSSTLLLICLMLIPLIWNGISLMHHLVEHTHAFCSSKQEDHQHSSAEDCYTICHFSPQHSQTRIPTTGMEFYDLKQCISDFYSFKNQFLIFNTTSTYTHYFLHSGRDLSGEIFRPPIS